MTVAVVIGAIAVVLVVGAGASLLLFYATTGAPPVPSSRAEATAVIELLRQSRLPEHATIVELGCGWGGLACAVAAAFPEAHIVGVELSPLPALVARLRSRGRGNLEIVRSDFHEMALDDADAVTTYLMIEPMVRLAETLDRRLPAGAAVVALAFWFRDRRPQATRGNAALYRWPAR